MLAPSQRARYFQHSSVPEFPVPPLSSLFCSRLLAFQQIFKSDATWNIQDKINLSVREVVTKIGFPVPFPKLVHSRHILKAMFRQELCRVLSCKYLETKFSELAHGGESSLLQLRTAKAHENGSLLRNLESGS